MRGGNCTCTRGVGGVEYTGGKEINMFNREKLIRAIKLNEALGIPFTRGEVQYTCEDEKIVARGVEGEKLPKRIEILEGTDEIGDVVFGGTEIEEVVIPSTVRVIGWDAFRHCKRLAE